MYYRLQSDNYNITSSHQSYIWSAGSLEDAMLRDLANWGIIESIYDLDNENDSEKIKQLWNDNYNEFCDFMSDNYYNGERYTEPGTSCFSSIEELIEYFSQDDKTTLGYNYLLTFEGEYISEGFDGECVVKFEREISRKYFNFLEELLED